MKKFALLVSSLMVAGIFNLGCVHKVVYAEGTATARNDKASPTAEVTAEWMKNKEDRIDLMLWIANTSKSPFYLKQSSFHLNYDGQKVTALNVPAFIEIQAGERRQQLAIFKLNKVKTMGENAVLTLDPITEGAIEKPGAALSPIKLVLPVTQP